MTPSKPFYVSLFSALSVFLFSISISCKNDQSPGNEWKAPADAARLANPVPVNAASIQKGKTLYNQYCAACHGENGFGDGAARGPLGDKPANFHNEKTRKQTNGELFWKLTKGRKDMPAFEKILPDEQRWQIISYIRQIPERSERKPPVALRAGVGIRHYMKIDSLAVRILQHPKTGNLWYTTFDGKVYQVKEADKASPSSQLEFTAKDHGIDVLQGAAFLDNWLFLCGNVYTKNKISTRGRMVRLDLDAPRQSQLTVVFNTVEYGANKTIYDHGWNGLVVSPDKKYVYANSGARTDHGEIQDNGGVYPNARDNALTAKIFRIPADAKDLQLPDDVEQLKKDGYLFAEGIRNAYDLCFDGDGNLFGVSNSADYDYPEDMFWIREGHHYGFPWVMGGLENPQQFDDWQPEKGDDPFINKRTHAWRTNYYYNDPGFPRPPTGVRFTPGLQNIGPDANEYRGHTGKILDGDETGIAISTFTAHCCPLGLLFDTNKTLDGDLRGSGFVLRFTSGARSSLMRPFTNEGCDLLQLRLAHDEARNNFTVKTNRLVEGFDQPVDAILIDNTIYVIEYDGKEGNIWQIILPGSKSKRR